MLSGSDLAYALKTRANIYNTRSILAPHVEKAPRDWDGLEIQIAQEASDRDDLHTSLSDYLKEELENNYKIISFFKLKEEPAEIFKQMAAQTPASRTYSYPTVLRGTELNNLSNYHEVAEIFQDANVTRITLTRKRVFTLRKKIDREKLDSDAQNALGMYDDVFGVANYNWQTFDIITLDHETNILNVRADYTRSESSYQNQKQIDISLGETIGWAVIRCAQLGMKFIPGDITNLFPAIPHFTFTHDGHISKLHFLTPQGSVKQDTMKKGEDLRLEVFHAKGMEAVGGQITPFDISIIWHHANRFGPGQEVELTIPSSLVVASAGEGAAQSYAILRYCSTEADSRLLIEKLLGALPDES